MSELRHILEAEGGLIAGALGPAGDDGDDDELHVAAIREGQRLHAGSPQLVTEAEPDLALLAGDRLYALGLERLPGPGGRRSRRRVCGLGTIGPALR